MAEFYENAKEAEFVKRREFMDDESQKANKGLGRAWITRL